MKLSSAGRNRSFIAPLHLRQNRSAKLYARPFDPCNARKHNMPTHRRARVFAFFASYLANKAPEQGPGSRTKELPRSTEVVGKSESWLQPVPSELHSCGVRASDFPDDASIERAYLEQVSLTNVGSETPQLVVFLLLVQFCWNL